MLPVSYTRETRKYTPVEKAIRDDQCFVIATVRDKMNETLNNFTRCYTKYIIQTCTFDIVAIQIYNPKLRTFSGSNKHFFHFMKRMERPMAPFPTVPSFQYFSCNMRFKKLIRSCCVRFPWAIPYCIGCRVCQEMQITCYGHSHRPRYGGFIVCAFVVVFCCLL